MGGEFHPLTVVQFEVGRIFLGRFPIGEVAELVRARGAVYRLVAAGLALGGILYRGAERKAGHADIDTVHFLFADAEDVRVDGLSQYVGSAAYTLGRLLIFFLLPVIILAISDLPKC